MATNLGFCCLPFTAARGKYKVLPASFSDPGALPKSPPQAPSWVGQAGTTGQAPSPRMVLGPDSPPRAPTWPGHKPTCSGEPPPGEGLGAGSSRGAAHCPPKAQASPGRRRPHLNDDETEAPSGRRTAPAREKTPGEPSAPSPTPGPALTREWGPQPRAWGRTRGGGSPRSHRTDLSPPRECSPAAP